jgi:DNA-binding protein HU-beta
VAETTAEIRPCGYGATSINDQLVQPPGAPAPRAGLETVLHAEVAKMNKTELVEKIAEDAGLQKSAAEGALKAALNAITDAVAAGEKVTLPGFGTFERRQRSAREGRNPQTGETLRIAASKVPAFKAGATFKSYVGMSTKDQKAHRQSR